MPTTSENLEKRLEKKTERMRGLEIAMRAGQPVSSAR